MDEYIVYIQIDSTNVVTDINSSAFLTDTNRWIEIDHGIGDKYHHAQSNYLDHGLYDENGIYNYKYINNELVLRTNEDKFDAKKKLNASIEINNLKFELSNTDYIAAKIAEGAATKEDYADQLAQRQQWRDRINELESIINN